MTKQHELKRKWAWEEKYMKIKIREKIQDRQAGEGGNKIRLNALIGNALLTIPYLFFQSKCYYWGGMLVW